MENANFNELVRVVADRVSKLDYFFEYSYDELDLEHSKPRVFTVLFRGVGIVKFAFDPTKDFNSSPHGSITIERAGRSDKYLTCPNAKGIIVDRNLLCLDSTVMTLEKVLDTYLPMKEVDKIALITRVLHEKEIIVDSIKLDSITKTYVVSFDLNHFLNLNKSNSIDDAIYYKYMSLDTYHKMLVKSSFRMNSIISMNDTTESFLMNDYIFGTDNDCSVSRIRELIGNKNALISSFTHEKDDANMWRLYGDNGSGLCLGFRAKKNNIKEIIYLNENEGKCRLLKETVDELRGYNIKIGYKGIDDLKYYAKKDLFNIEKEYRLLQEVSNNCEIALYGNLLCHYRDYKFDKDTCSFEEIEISPISLIIGDNLPNKDVNVPLLISLSKDVFGIPSVQTSDIKCFRV